MEFVVYFLSTVVLPIYFYLLLNILIICCKQLKWFYHEVMSPKDADCIGNKEGPDQTAPTGAVYQTAPVGVV